MEDVAQSAGTECQVQSCDHIFGFNNANNIADLAAQIDNVKLNSVLDHYGVLIACGKLVGNLVKGNGLCALMDSHVHPPMNAGAVNLTPNSSQHLIQEYASVLLAEGHTLNIVTELGRAYAFQKLNFNFKVFILKELTKCQRSAFHTVYYEQN